MLLAIDMKNCKNLHLLDIQDCNSANSRSAILKKEAY